ncbi:MAG: GDSL-type esterase/lipase family protein [Chitinophagaceae bacterium]
MNNSLRLLTAGLFFVLLSSMSFQKPKKVIFFGDSITQAAVNPNGFITKIGQALEKKGVKANYELIGAGIGGNKVYDLYLRLESDVLSKDPNLVVIYVGVNDVWHKATSGTGTDPDKFVKFYEALIRKLQEKKCGIIICTPAVIGEKTDFTNQQDGDMNKYAGMLRILATKNNIPVCDLRKAFLDYNLANNPENKESGILTVDRVHLNDKGNQLVTDLLLPMITK